MALHYLKPPAVRYQGSELRQQRRATRFGATWAWIREAFNRSRATPRCWPLLRFVWHAGTLAIRCLDPTLWWLLHRRCTFAAPYCRPPLLGAAHWKLPNGAAWRGTPKWYKHASMPSNHKVR